MPLKIVRSSEPEAVRLAVEPMLERFMTERAGPPVREPFALALLDPDGRTVGGLFGLSLWGSFHVHVVFVPESLRGRGLGADLLRQAEAEARRRGCRHMWLDTYAFEARPFYERLGFAVFGQLDGPGPIFPRYFMRKVLSAA
jgi:GNAT superfamily N-acetyltransferase